MTLEELVAQRERDRVELIELRTLVLSLHQKMRQWVERQRESRAIGLGGDEDFLNTYFDKSLLAKRREKVRNG